MPHKGGRQSRGLKSQRPLEIFVVAVSERYGSERIPGSSTFRTVWTLPAARGLRDANGPAQRTLESRCLLGTARGDTGRDVDLPPLLPDLTSGHDRGDTRSRRPLLTTSDRRCCCTLAALSSRAFRSFLPPEVPRLRATHPLAGSPTRNRLFDSANQRFDATNRGGPIRMTPKRAKDGGVMMSSPSFCETGQV